MGRERQRNIQQEKTLCAKVLVFIMKCAKYATMRHVSLTTERDQAMLCSRHMVSSLKS